MTNLRPSLKFLFGVNVFLLLIELILFVACYVEWLAMDYGWDGRMNRNALGFAIGSQVIFLFLISKMEELALKHRMLLGQCLFAVSIILWASYMAEVHYLRT